MFSKEFPRINGGQKIKPLKSCTKQKYSWCFSISARLLVKDSGLCILCFCIDIYATRNNIMGYIFRAHSISPNMQYLCKLDSFFSFVCRVLITLFRCCWDSDGWLCSITNEFHSYHDDGITTNIQWQEWLKRTWNLTDKIVKRQP